jgi:hypothetical protein
MKTIMRRSSVFKIAGIVVVVFWLSVLMALVRKTHVTSKTPPAAQTPDEPQGLKASGEWMEILLKGRKVGYTVRRVTRLKEEYEITEEIFLTVALMGSGHKILSCTRAIVDEEFRLNRFDFSLSSDVIRFAISGCVKGEDLLLELGEPGKKEIRSINIPEKPMISAGLTQFLRSRALEVGESFAFPVFDPVSMTTNPVAITVTAEERVKVNGEAHKAFRLEMKFLGRPLLLWVDENGVPLREEGFMGFTLVRSNPLKAQLGLDESGRLDFYDLSAIKVKEEIRKPRTVSYLKVAFDRVPPSLPDNGIRQSLHEKVLSVNKERPPFTASYTIPYRGTKDELLQNLRPELLVQCEDREIRELAKEIIDDTTDPFVASRKIMNWAFETIDKVPLVSVPDAKQILILKKGDCNEHATLVTALLRSIGIPARIVVGLVYRDGRFYYHAWNEAHIHTWISLDAILNQMPADATHIKLVNGGIEKQIQIAALIGTLNLTVLEYR